MSTFQQKFGIAAVSSFLATSAVVALRGRRGECAKSITDAVGRLVNDDEVACEALQDSIETIVALVEHWEGTILSSTHELGQRVVGGDRHVECMRHVLKKFEGMTKTHFKNDGDKYNPVGDKKMLIDLVTILFEFHNFWGFGTEWGVGTECDSGLLSMLKKLIETIHRDKDQKSTLSNQLCMRLLFLTENVIKVEEEEYKYPAAKEIPGDFWITATEKYKFPPPENKEKYKEIFGLRPMIMDLTADLKKYKEAMDVTLVSKLMGWMQKNVFIPRDDLPLLDDKKPGPVPHIDENKTALAALFTVMLIKILNSPMHGSFTECVTKKGKTISNVLEKLSKIAQNHDYRNSSVYTYAQHKVTTIKNIEKIKNFFMHMNPPLWPSPPPPPNPSPSPSPSPPSAPAPSPPSISLTIDGLKQMLSNKDPFEKLGLEEGADIQKIKHNYRMLSKIVHPDKCKYEDKEKCAEIFEKLNDAKAEAEKASKNLKIHKSS